MGSLLSAGMSHARFIRLYWQKKPLLLRRAFRDFRGLLSPRTLMGLACRDDAQARLVIRHGKRWELRQGPFRPGDFRALPARGWSLLVQEVNHLLPEAESLLRAFSFIPYARLDDVMVSFAPDGGGVGPHFDSYDVFLLQGMGRRRWQVSAQRDRELVAGAPLRILKRFRPGHEWVLEPGDMLYLPPRYAHNGIAVGDCMTYSIGFRAPSNQELALGFLDHLAETLSIPGMYRDPDLVPQREPARISGSMLDKVAGALSRVRWTRSDVMEFLGRHLSEPKPHVLFQRRRRPETPARFEARCAARGIFLDPRSGMLYSGRTVFLNGEANAIGSPRARDQLKRLANRRALAPFRPDPEAMPLLYRWYRDGYIHPTP